jgi:hypothetical protein
VGSSHATFDQYQIIKVDRNSDGAVNINHDSALYSRKELNVILAMLDDGNRAHGGLVKVTTAHGIIGKRNTYGLRRNRDVYYLFIFNCCNEVQCRGFARIAFYLSYR